MPLPATVDPGFETLLRIYRDTPVDFPQLKPVTFSQWAKESGWGRSNLAKKFKNYGGAKWRTYMAPYATPVTYSAWDGISQYCHFGSQTDWIKGYWARFDLEPAYKGWRKHTENEATFMRFVGPIWLGMGTKAGDDYVRDVIRIRDDWKFTTEFQYDNQDDSKDTYAHALLDWDDLRDHFGLPRISGLRGTEVLAEPAREDRKVKPAPKDKPVDTQISGG